MRLSFKDFYGQYVDVNDETASGNIRIRVRTTENLNDVASTPEKDCTIETDISLNNRQASMLLSMLHTMLEDEDD